MRSRIMLLLVAIQLVCPAGVVPADDLQNQLLKAAEKIVNVLKDKERESLSLGEFGPKAKGVEDTFGPGLRVELAQAFTQLAEQSDSKFNLVDNSEFVLSGVYEVIDDPADAGAVNKGLSQLLVIKIDLSLRDGAEVVFPHTFFVNRIRDIIKAQGGSGLFRLEDSTRELHKQLRESAQEPLLTLLGTQIKSNPTSPIAVEILTKPVLSVDSATAKAREPQNRGGLPFVPIAIGEVYEVRVHNGSNVEIAVAMTIDGIDQFTFSEDRDPRNGKPLYTHWIVPKRSPITIVGWHKTADPRRKDNVLRFLVTKYGDGASQFVPQPDHSKVGVIHVAISRSHERRAGARGDAETGFGPPVEVKQKVVERVIDPPHEFISIRYAQSR